MPQHGRTSHTWPIWMVILADVLGIGIGLCVFALFHHVLPRAYDQAPIDIVRPGGTGTATAPTGSDATGGSPTDAAQGQFGARFADKFSDTVQRTADRYVGPDCRVEIQETRTTIGGRKVAYYVADIYIRDVEHFRTAFADDTFGKGIKEPVLDMAKRHQAIVAISGDYYGFRENTVIRNGKLYRKGTGDEDICVLYYDGTMKTFGPDAFDVDQAVRQGAYQAWTFGPRLLENGKAATRFNTAVGGANPRSAIGYYEPGHYCFVFVDGRKPDVSTGMSMTELSQLFADLGCVEAYNLDGGYSACMVFGDEKVVEPANGGRVISDILYIGA